jgi:hypothetical protein
MKPAVSQTVHHKINGLENELEIMWMGSSYDIFELLSWHLLQGTETTHENLSEQPLSQPKLDPVTF